VRGRENELSVSISDQIRALEDLAAIDAELKTLGDDLQQERGALDAQRKKLTQLEDKLKNDRTQLGAIEKLRNEYVIEVRTMMQQLEHSREKMNRARNEREANAAQRELEELRKLVRDREDEIGRLTTDADAARQQIDMGDEEAKKVSADLGATEGGVQSKLTDIEKQQTERNVARAEAVKRLPVPLYRRYDMVRQKRGTGIAQTTTGTCNACNMSLPPQLFHRLRRETILEQCQSCNRIIYYVPPASAGSEGVTAEQGKG
jgi:predicted  nucleic acid-binding Zn-ribbon protein